MVKIKYCKADLITEDEERAVGLFWEKRRVGVAKDKSTDYKHRERDLVFE